MKRILFIIIFFGLITQSVLAQMSDQQVIDYVKRESLKGTSQQAMGVYLLSRGVSPAQVERITSMHELESAQVSSETSSAQLRRERREDPMESEVNSGDFDLIRSEIINTSSSPSQIFGHNIFNSRNLSFTPNSNIPTPSNYKLGPGDEVIITIWGASQEYIRKTISPEGSIIVDRIGPVYLSGMTVSEATRYVKRRLADVYPLESEQSEILLTLGQIRTIQINVLGDVSLPGTYSLSSMSSLFHALYRAGGVTNIGSLRAIKLYRDNKLIKTVDVYRYLLEGALDDDVRLADNDVVIVSPYISLVNISGKVKRNMYYEVKEGETLDQLIKYAGGFEGDAYREKVRVSRTTGAENLIFTVTSSEFSTFVLHDKDAVSVGSGIDLFENRVEILGAVYRTGYYEIGKEVKTIKELINAADGLRGDVFLNRAVLTRENTDLTTTSISVDLERIVQGTSPDITLQKNDILYIPSIHDLTEFGEFVIHGSVARPGSYKYSENTTLEDLVVRAGGLLPSASVMRVDIARRVMDPKGLEASDIISNTFSLSIKDGFLVGGEKEFVLEPYDHIYIRRSPEYFPQRNVFLSGEVLFPGTYALTQKTERLSDIIARAGGATKHAFIEGARLVRERSSEEAYRSRVALRMAAHGDTQDAIEAHSLETDRYYSIGIDLNKALSAPGSDWDLVLREGDRILIPEYENTVKINGAVMFPNTVSFNPGQNSHYYLDQAGGYTNNAKKRKMYVIYMNGMVSRVSRNDSKVIRPGSEIIIPTKEEHRKMTTSEIVHLGSTVTSMASIIALLIRTLM